MNFNKDKKRKKLGSFTSIILAFCVTVTSATAFTNVVEAGEITPKSIAIGKLRELIGLKKSKGLNLTSEEIVNYDFSNYRVVDADAKKYTRTFNGVDTVIQLIIYNDDPSLDIEKIMDETESLVNEYENVVSKTKKDSFTYTLNSTGEYDYSTSEYSNIIKQLYDKSKHYAELSKGALDVTIQPVVKLWNINNGNTEVPLQSNIDSALKPVDINNFVLDSQAQKYKLLNDAQVDFGAIGKGQLADIIKASLMSKGINSALINLGGNVITIGAKPGDKNWVIGIQNPRSSTGESLGTIEIKNKSVVTSGDYERFFMNNGVRYHHIMDTKTGYPSNSGLIQTTIISERSMDCDALSTTTFLLGEKEGLKLIEGLDGFECMFVGENMDYSFSENFVDNYNLNYTK